MANFNGYRLRSYPDNNGYNVIRTLHKAFTSDSSVTYIHFKTNVPIASYIMTMIEAVGYNYGMYAPIRCAWAFNTNGTGDVQHQTFGYSTYSGISPKAIYTSSDNYVCISAFASDGSYFNGFVLNGYQTAGNGRGYDLQITAASYGTNSGNAF